MTRTRSALGRSSSPRLDTTILVVGAIACTLIVAVTTLYALEADDGALYLGGVLTGLMVWFGDMVRGRERLRRTYAPRETENAREQSQSFTVEAPRPPTLEVPDELGAPWEPDTQPDTPRAGRPGREAMRTAPPRRDPTGSTNTRRERRDPTGPVVNEPASPQVKRERERGDR